VADIIKLKTNLRQTSRLPLEQVAALPYSMETATVCLLVVLERLTREVLSLDIWELAIWEARDRCR